MVWGNYYLCCVAFWESVIFRGVMPGQSRYKQAQLITLQRTDQRAKVRTRKDRSAMATKKAKQAQEAETQSVLGYFANLPDPRRNNENKRHQLIDIIAIAILATICGANHFTEMEQFGKANEDFLRSLLELPNGIPSHDTIGEVFARLDASEFRKCFISWVEAIRMAT